MNSSFVYHDLSALNDIKLQARQDEVAALHNVAQQFESMLLDQMFKTSRSTLEIINPDSLMSGHAASTWQQMHDQQMALTLSANGGMGLADALVDQWASQLGLSGKELPSEVQGLELMDRPRVLRAPELTAEQIAALQARQQASQRPSAQTPTSEVPVMLARSQAIESDQGLDQDLDQDLDLPAHVLNFVAKLLPSVNIVAEELGVDPRFILAQAALETGWGRQMIRTQDGQNSHNLFGIKSHRDWQGPSAQVMTHEYRQGVRLQQQDGFRVYQDYEHSMRDYVEFLRSNPRYQQALASASDGHAYAQALQKAGYATDPRYAQKIISIAEGVNLNQALASLEAS